MSERFEEKMRRISKTIKDYSGKHIDSIFSLLGDTFSPKILENLNGNSIIISEDTIKKRLITYLDEDDNFSLENLKIDEEGIEFQLLFKEHFLDAKISFNLVVSKFVINSSEQSAVLRISEHKLEGVNLITKIISPIIELILDSILARKVSKLNMHYDIKNQEISVNLNQIDIIKQLSLLRLPFVKKNILDLIQITGIEHCKGCAIIKYDVSPTIEKLLRRNSEENIQCEHDK